MQSIPVWHVHHVGNVPLWECGCIASLALMDGTSAPSVMSAVSVSNLRRIALAPVTEAAHHDIFHPIRSTTYVSSLPFRSTNEMLKPLLGCLRRLQCD